MRFIASLALAAALLAGCAPATRVVLLPQPDGSASAVEVTSAAGAAVLSQPYAAAEVRTRAVDTRQLDAEAVRKRYGQLLSVQPGAPERFTLYFLPGTSSLPHLLDDLGAAEVTLTPEVMARLEALINEKTVTGSRYAEQGNREVDTEAF